MGQKNFADMYYNGEGIKQNKQEAIKWYKKSAEQGSAKAQCNLGYMYESGDGVTIDKEEAKKWYKKSADQGNEDAKKALNRL